MRRTRGSLVLAFLALVPAMAGAEERRLDLAFLPPLVVPQDLCAPAAAEDDTGETDLDPGGGSAVLTDALRLRYLRRDIRNYQADDPDRWFDFIETLIARQAELDPDFAGTGATLARVALHVDAGRLEALEDLGLIGSLLQGPIRLTNAQRAAIAQFYLTGTGVPQDRALGLTLLREAAFAGNADALLAIAGMLARGEDVPEWDASADLTLTLAFGGMLGQMNAEVCDRALRIARHYIDGDIVVPNPDIALAWYRFAADLGSGDAAWRVVAMLRDAPPARRDTAALAQYLEMAVERGVPVGSREADRLRAVSGADRLAVERILARPVLTTQDRPSLAGYLDLEVTPVADGVTDGPYLQYLAELARIDTAPGDVFTRLAEEILARRGRWAGEAEAATLLQEAVERDDPDAMLMLARMEMRYRDDPARLNRAINLNLEALDRFGAVAAMTALDSIYRCQAPAAPMEEDAAYWAMRYNAAGAAAVTISPGDLMTLDPFKDPETIAEIQSQALRGVATSVAAFARRVDADPLASDAARRLWADRLDGSGKALELFADMEQALAMTPADRDRAIGLFRRVALHNGVGSALDLAVALIEDSGRDPAVAAEIVDLLTRAGNRGEGAAIRLLARLTQDRESEAAVYARFAEVIETRGDFLALMFAIPHVDADRAADYVARAVSLMSCGTKDADELGDAAAIMGDAAMSYHWRRVGLAVENGHVLSKLSLSDRQMGYFDTGAAPGPRDVAERLRAEGDPAARLALIALRSDPGLPGYSPAAAAVEITALLSAAGQESLGLTAYRRAGADVQAAVRAAVDMGSIFLAAAERGDAAAARDYGLMLRESAVTPDDLTLAAGWLQQAAEAGDTLAMTAWGEALAFGFGTPEDRPAALTWLERAERAGDPAAARLARLLRIEATP